MFFNGGECLWIEPSKTVLITEIFLSSYGIIFTILLIVKFLISKAHLKMIRWEESHVSLGRESPETVGLEGKSL